MADVTLQIHYITSGLGGGGLYMTGQYIRVIADGSAVRAELWTDSTGGTFIATPSGGPDLSGDGIVVSSGSFTDPQQCISGDLHYYSVSNEWPYAVHHIATDHPSCVIIVCDLTITGFSTVNETTYGVSNGEIHLTATSSNGTIEFSLTPDFAYGTGQASPITGLPTGNYIVFAKDAAGCTDQINVFVGIDYIYAVKWRTEYDHIKPEGYVTRIDIEQRDYSGEIIWADSGDQPFLLEYNPGDTQLVPSEATIQLLVRRGEEGKFDDIRVGDDRQHVVKKYIDRGSGWELEWLGYVSPEFYEEPYIFEPYVISIKAIDGLGELKNKPFVMDSGDPYFDRMYVIDIISECLKKLPVTLNIHSCVNIFEERMDTGSDPLVQAVIEADNYKGKTCEEVISALIKPFTGAELFQSMGSWWIRTREQAVDSVIDYRIFNKDGNLTGSDTISARKNLGFPRTTSRLCWADRSALLKYTRPYGKVTITHTLDKDNNMIDEGGFELDDIDPSTEFFRGWNLFPLQAGVSSGLEYVDNGDSKSAFYFQWPPGGIDDQALNSLVYREMPINIGVDYGTGNVAENASTSFKLKFSVYVSPTYKVDYIWMGWKLRFTDTVSGDFWDWEPTSGTALSVTPTVNVEHINDLYISDYHSWKTYEFLNFRFPGPPTVESYTIQPTFYFHNHRGRDFSSYDQLRDFVTETGTEPSIEGKRFYVAIGDNTLYYQLENNTEAESGPDIIRPDDYNAVSNPFQWVLQKTYNPDGDVPLLEKILIDNVSISMFAISPILTGPGIALIDPPETATYSETITDRNESTLSEEVLNGDAPPLVGAEYIYNGFFTLDDGTPTKYWSRTTIEERTPLLSIYLSYLTAQGAKGKRILSGSAIADIQIGYINSLIDQIDNRKYRFLRFALDDKKGQYDFEAEETLVGDDGESPPVLGSYSSAYSDAYDI